MPAPLWSTADQWTVLPHHRRHRVARRGDPPTLRLSYADGHGVLRAALRACTERGFIVRDIDVTREDLDDDGSRVAAVTLELVGRGDLGDLGDLAELPGVHTAHTGRNDHE